jgi:hypothetical protein
MIRTNTSYDYCIGNILLYKITLKKNHSTGNLCLLRTPARLENDPTVYSKDHYERVGH